MELPTVHLGGAFSELVAPVTAYQAPIVGFRFSERALHKATWPINMTGKEVGLRPVQIKD